MSASESAVDLTPTEQVLFFADQFAPKGSVMKGKEPLLLAEGNVAVNPLAETLLSVAFLALEKAGVVRLEVATRKSLFGLLKRQVVEVQPAGGRATFPEGTLEALLARRLPTATADASKVVHDFYAEDMKWPHQFLLDVAKAALGERGLLTLEATKKLLVFTTYKATVPPATRAALQGRSPDDARALLKGAESRPELWKALQAQVASGILGRTEQQAADTDFGSD